MPLQKLAFKVAPENARARLDQFLAEKLPAALKEEVSKGKVRKLIVAGAVYLNGSRVRIASKELIPGARVEVFIDRQKLGRDAASQEKSTGPFQMQASDILFEDEYLIAVNKPAGLPTQPTLDEARDNLYAAVRRFLSKRDGVIEPYVGLHHRLDRDTSGVILFTKKKEANVGVAELFTAHIAEKTYFAVTERPKAEKDLPPEKWEVKNYLGKAKGGTGKRARFTAVRSGGDPAHTDFELIEEMSKGLWIQARPRTGRTHQIRVHLFEQGLPIQGDPVYGPSRAAKRTLLHAVSLTFPHPIHKTKTSVFSPPPEDFIQCLRALQSRKLDSFLEDFLRKLRSYASTGGSTES